MKFGRHALMFFVAGAGTAMANVRGQARKVAEVEIETPVVAEVEAVTPAEAEAVTPEVADAEAIAPEATEAGDVTPEVAEAEVDTPEVAEAEVKTPEVAEAEVKTPEVAEAEDVTAYTVCMPSPCAKRLAQVQAEDPMFTSDKCYFDKDADPTQGCWFPVTNLPGPGGVTFDSSEGVAELIDEYCECHLAYEIGCISKIPFGEIGEDNGDFTYARFTSGDGSTPSQYGKYCVFGGIWNGDFGYDDNCGLDDELMKCGCLWIDAVEDKVDDCFGVELGDYH